MEAHDNCKFTGICHKCNLRIRGCDSACQAMGNLYHAHCFVCRTCGKELKGHEFYQLEGMIYCGEDYKRSELYQPFNSCYVCKNTIGDRILQTLGRSYHPSCFRCSVCYMELEAIPFTVDKYEEVFCIPDYHRKYSPRCDHCKQPIVPHQESDEIVRVVCLGKQYHEECFRCEECGAQLSNKEGKQCYPFEKRLFCLKCNTNRQSHIVVSPQRNVILHSPANSPSNSPRVWRR